ncbi:MAG: CYTH domain-containing protein [Myxococcaceae bacterium]
MIQEIELKYRFKNQQAYKTLLDSLSGEHRRENQINYLFDTPDLKLKAQHVFVRLRKSNELFKFTCKAAPEGTRKRSKILSIHDEWEEVIPKNDAQKLLDGLLSPIDLIHQTWPRISPLKRIQEITKETLGLVGSFKNTRIHVPYSIGTHQLDLEFDATDFGNGQIDYELELELPEDLLPRTAEASMNKLFKQFEIETGASSGKADRFFNHIALPNCRLS